MFKALAEFQFHKGTIKTQGINTAAQTFIAFQFHKGTIKTIRQQYTFERIGIISIP